MFTRDVWYAWVGLLVSGLVVWGNWKIVHFGMILVLVVSSSFMFCFFVMLLSAQWSVVATWWHRKNRDLEMRRFMFTPTALTKENATVDNFAKIIEQGKSLVGRKNKVDGWEDNLFDSKRLRWAVHPNTVVSCFQGQSNLATLHVMQDWDIPKSQVWLFWKYSVGGEHRMFRVHVVTVGSERK